jgi:hypothetical protein
LNYAFSSLSPRALQSSSSLRLTTTKKYFSIVQQLLLTSAFTWFLHAWVSAFFPLLPFLRHHQYHTPKRPVDEEGSGID